MFRTKNGFLTCWAMMAVMFCGLIVGCGGGEVIDDGNGTENGQDQATLRARWDELMTEAKAKLTDGRLKEAETAINEAKDIKPTSALKDLWDELQEEKTIVDEKSPYDWLKSVKGTADHAEKVRWCSYALSAGISEKNVWLAHKWRGLAYVKLDKFAEAEEDFNWVLDMKPENATAHYYLGYLSYKTKSYEDAASHFEDAVNAAPDQLEYLYWMGLAKMGSGDLTGAVDAFQLYIDEGGMKRKEKAEAHLDRLQEKLGG